MKSHPKKEEANLIPQTGLYLWRQRPEFILSLPKDSHTPCACSTISHERERMGSFAGFLRLKKGKRALPSASELSSIASGVALF
jgi:hypothetical protein